jgi:hypothetical protein
MRDRLLTVICLGSWMRPTRVCVDVSQKVTVGYDEEVVLGPVETSGVCRGDFCGYVQEQAATMLS